MRVECPNMRTVEFAQCRSGFERKAAISQRMVDGKCLI
jgi:hypothetical protein